MCGGGGGLRSDVDVTLITLATVAVVSPLEVRDNQVDGRGQYVTRMAVKKGQSQLISWLLCIHEATLCMGDISVTSNIN